MCLAENLAGKAKQNLELQVLRMSDGVFLWFSKENWILVPPKFRDDLVSIEAVINSTINLTCSAYGNPKPTVRERKKKALAF